MSAPSEPFRFRDLPPEIRDRIYRELLCDFKPRLTTMYSANMGQAAPAPHEIDTAILRTSTTVYREAYDIMVKTNRFVKVTSVRGLAMNALLSGMQVPVVAANKKIVDQFGGYVLAVHLDTAQPITPTAESESKIVFKPRTLMILHRDMDVFCHALIDGDACCPGFIRQLQITIKLPPLLNVPQPTTHSPSFANFFSDATQKALLAPFRAILRGFMSVTVQGHIDQDLARAVQAEVKQDRWSEPTQVLADFKAAKAKGSVLFHQRDMEDARLVWQNAADEIGKVIVSSSWSTLCERGGEQFISELAELYFLVRLNSALTLLNDMQGQSSLDPYVAGAIAEDSLNQATRSLKQNYWMDGYQYRPSTKQLAKLKYRYALLMRLQNEPGTAERALIYIDGALRSQPDDPAIMREREIILAWLQWADQYT